MQPKCLSCSPFTKTATKPAGWIYGWYWLRLDDAAHNLLVQLALAEWTLEWTTTATRVTIHLEKALQCLTHIYASPLANGTTPLHRALDDARCISRVVGHGCPWLRRMRKINGNSRNERVPQVRSFLLCTLFSSFRLLSCPVHDRCWSSVVGV